jgi:NAD(P)-dependent dehydrogenase (short-subunit alcohol dehydrogenase family)
MKDTVIINGAAGGIGKAIVESLMANYHLILLVRTKASAVELEDYLTKTLLFRDYMIFVLDSGNKDDFERVFNDLKQKNISNIKGIVNTVGFVKIGSLSDVDESDWLSAFNICFMGVVRTIKYFSQLMTSGSIVLINGILSQYPKPNPIIASSMTGAVSNFAKAMAIEMIDRNIRVNVVNPSLTDTPLIKKIASQLTHDDDSYQGVIKSMESSTPMGRFIKPKEIADSVKFLIASSSEYINNISLNIDGGVQK